jgi:hypothetical protein
MQIAFFAVSKLPKSERGTHKIALKTCDCLFRNGGKNLPGFMCGRQMTVTLCFFVIARVTTLNVEVGTGNNVFGVSDGIQNFFNLGFLGAITTTILGSIAWQLVAGAFPIAFLSNPIVYIFLQLALFLEATGICAAAWFLGMIQKKVMGFQYDEVYIGTPEERAAKGHADDDEVENAMHLGTYIPDHHVGEHKITHDFMDTVQINFTNQREKVMDNISDLRAQTKLASNDAERKVFEDAYKLELECLKNLNSRHADSMRDLDSMMNPTTDKVDEEALVEEMEGGAIALMRENSMRDKSFVKRSNEGLTLGVGAIVSFPVKYIHPHAARDAVFPQREKGQRLENCGVVRRGLKSINHQHVMCAFVNHADFKDEDGNAIEIWAKEDHVKIDKEGNPEMFF